MKHAAAILAMLAFALTCAAASSAAKPDSATCSASPNPAALNSVVTVSASGLPTIAPDYLIVTKPDGTRTFSAEKPLNVDSSGNSTVTVVADQAGTWTFEYSGMVKDRGKYFYAAVATCTETVT